MNKTRRITVVIIDERRAVQEGLKNFLVKARDFEVKGLFDDLQTGIEQVNQCPCDIVIIGAPLFVLANRRDGLMRSLKRQPAGPPWVALYVEPKEEKHFYHDVALGVDGHIRSKWDRRETLNGLRCLCREGILLTREGPKQYAQFVREKKAVVDTLTPLDEWDQRLARCVVDGKCDKEIGVTMGKKSERTGRRYREALFKKIGARTYKEAIPILISLGAASSNGHRPL